MPFIEVNDCRLYYETYGVAQTNQAPIVLIHGSTQTGASCWSTVAPILARRYHVIVPDCRGHGQSTNPAHTYSFKELAADTAGLVLAFGYPRAHIIGHSNGGNVALVTLLEYPEIVQSAVLQAANAYVSQDLVDKEPAIFDPERVSREAPSWRDEMVSLHGAAHGPEYWRDLLAMTVHEIISQPNYTTADLAKVLRPTLVIQGGNDRVNAPSRHGEFIAAHIPNAEYWLPVGIGHTVHDEQLTAWTEKVLDFLFRRGDDLNDALFRLKRRRYRDDRIFLFQPHAELIQSASQTVTIHLSGSVLRRAESNQVVQTIQEYSDFPIGDEIAVLLDDAPWGLVRRPVNDLRREASIHAERLNQALIGEALQVLRHGPEWSLVRLQKDGYLGWLENNAIHVCSQAEADAYRDACNARVQAELLPARSIVPMPDPAGDINGRLPFGIPVVVTDFHDETATLRLPDGELWQVSGVGLLTNLECPGPDAAGIKAVLKLIRHFIGIPYLWGGRSPYGYDCSGLAQTFWGFLGITIPRDADQQFQAGAAVKDPPLPGDLLFFGKPDQISGERFANINHVAISLGGADFIHSNGAAWGISINSLEPASPLYRPSLAESLAGIRRFS